MIKRIFPIVVSLLFCGCAVPPPQQFRDVDTAVYARVHIVSDKSQLPYDATSRFPGLIACAYPTGDIYVIGSMTPYGIEIDPWVFGHEMLHLIHWQTNGRVRNPDK